MNARARAAHDEAVARGEDGYTDPDTGYFVFTSEYLRRRPCCENGCRHCPWTEPQSPAAPQANS